MTELIESMKQYQYIISSTKNVMNKILMKKAILISITILFGLNLQSVNAQFKNTAWHMKVMKILHI